MTGSVRKFLFGSTVRLVTPLDTATCIARLKAITGEGFLASLAIFSRKPMIGSVNEREFYWRKRIFYQNSFQTHLAAVFVPEDTGTRIICRFRLGLATKILMLVLILAILGGPLAALLTDMEFRVNGTPLVDPSERLLSALILPAIIVVMFGLGRLMARNDQGFMLQLLNDTLETREVSSAPSSAPGMATGAKPTHRMATIQR
ncbi:hypothetical protein [Dongia sp.]|uniref:hypothetical protein n=1 Tax=Dongia sp. TaxID=1977262 RepID=UPI0035AE8F5A